MQTTKEQCFIPNNSPFFMFQNQGLSKVLLLNRISNIKLLVKAYHYLNKEFHVFTHKVPLPAVLISTCHAQASYQFFYMSKPTLWAAASDNANV